MSGIGTGTPIVWSDWDFGGHAFTTFEDICSMFINLSGRADLEEPEYHPSVRLWVNQGMRLADLLSEFESRRRLFKKTLEAGSYSFTVPNVKRIWQVVSVSREGTKRDLKQRIEDEARIDPLPALIDRGVPCAYLLHRNVTVSGSEELGDSVVGGDASLEVDDFQLSIVPPPAEEVSIIVDGWFLEPYLVNRSDTNWLVKNAPMAVLYFSLYHLERGYNNETGAQEWYRSGMLELASLDRVEASRLGNRYGEVR